MASVPTYPFDATGNALQNKVIGELYPLLVPATRTTLLVVPLIGPFYWESIEVKYVPTTGVSRILNKDVDYKPVFQYYDATSKANQMIVGGLQLTDASLAGTGQVMMNYQCVGGQYVVDPAGVWAQQRSWQIISTEMRDAFFTTWEQVTAAIGMPLPTFPVVDVQWQKLNSSSIQAMLVTMEEMGLVVSLRQRLLPSPDTAKFIPTPTEIGLGKVSNFPVATDTEAVDKTVNNRYMTPHTTALVAADVVEEKLALVGYRVPVDYVAGIVITDVKTTVAVGTDVYAPVAAALPLTTSGIFEKEKFVLVRSNDRDHWHTFVTTVTGSEPKDMATGALIIETNSQFESSVKSQVILNGVVETVCMIDHHLNGSKLFLEYPVDAGTEVKLLWKRTSSTMADDRPFYQTFLVSSGVVTFPLTNFGFMAPDDFRVTLNDFSILTLNIDYQIDAAGVMKVIRPLRLGDVIEVENNDMVPGIGKFQLRSILSATA